MLIDIKPRHLRNGVQCDGVSCPLSLALNEQTGHLWYVESDVAYRYRDGVEVPLSEKAAQFVRRYDRGQQPPPMQVPLDIPKSY